MLNNWREKVYQGLRWSEKYTKTDMVYLAHGGFWLTLGQIFSTSSGFLLALAFANLLPQETYGTYKYIISVASLLSTTTLAGIGNVISQAVARGYDGSFKPALKTRIKWGLLGGVLSLVVAGYYFLQGDSTLTIAFLIASVFIPFMDPLAMFDAILNGKKLFKQSTKYNTATKLISIAIMIATVFLTDNILLVVAAYFVPYTILRLIFIRLAMRRIENDKVDPQTVSYGKHSSVAAGLANIASYLDQLILFHFLGPINLAIYALAIAPIEQIKVAIKSFPALAMPKFATRTIAEISKLLYTRIAIFALIGFAFVAIYYWVAPYFYQIFFPQYLDSIPYSRLFSLVWIVMLPQMIFSPALSAKITLVPKKMLYLWNLPDVVLIASIIILVVPLGIYGVIISRIASRTTILLVNAFIWRYIKNRPEPAL